MFITLIYFQILEKPNQPDCCTFGRNALWLVEAIDVSEDQTATIIMVPPM